MFFLQNLVKLVPELYEAVSQKYKLTDLSVTHLDNGKTSQHSVITSDQGCMTQINRVH